MTALSRRYTRRGEVMATFVLEDLEAAIDVMVFPKTMLEYGALLEQDAIVSVKGTARPQRGPAEAHLQGDPAPQATDSRF